MNKKKIVFACLAASALSACGGETPYDGTSRLKELESVTGSFLFIDTVGKSTITNTNGDILADGNFQSVYLSPRGNVVNDASGSYLLKNGSLEKQPEPFRSCDYGSFYFYSEDSLTFAVKKSDGSPLVAPAYSKIDWANETNYIANDSEGLVFGSLTQEIKIKGGSLQRLLDSAKGTAIVNNASSYSLYSGAGALLTDPFLSYDIRGSLLLLHRDEGDSVYDLMNLVTLLSSGEVSSSATLVGLSPSCYAIADSTGANPVVYSFSKRLTEKGDYLLSYLPLDGAVLMVKEIGVYETVNSEGKKTVIPSLQGLIGSVSYDPMRSSFAYEGKDNQAYLYNAKANKLFCFDYASIEFANPYSNVDAVGGSYVFKKDNQESIFGLLSISGEKLFEKTLEEGQWLRGLGNGAFVGSSAAADIYGPCFDKPIQTINGEVKNIVDYGYFLGYDNGGENCYFSMTGHLIAKGKGHLAGVYLSDPS
jgi:hypothetical protein